MLVQFDVKVVVLMDAGGKISMGLTKELQIEMLFEAIFKSGESGRARSVIKHVIHVVKEKDAMTTFPLLDEKTRNRGTSLEVH